MDFLYVVIVSGARDQRHRMELLYILIWNALSAHLESGKVVASVNFV